MLSVRPITLGRTKHNKKTKGAAKTHRTKKRIKHNTTTANKNLKTLMIEPRIALCAQEYITSNRFEHQTSHHTTHHAMPHHVTCHTFKITFSMQCTPTTPPRAHTSCRAFPVRVGLLGRAPPPHHQASIHKNLCTSLSIRPPQGVNGSLGGSGGGNHEVSQVYHGCVTGVSQVYQCVYRCAYH